MNKLEIYLVKCINNADKVYYVSSLEQILFRVNRNKYNINIMDNAGYTLFMHAVMNKNTYLCDMLLFSGANPQIPQQAKGFGIYDIAIRHDKTGKMVEYLDSKDIMIVNPEKTIKNAIKYNKLVPLYYLFNTGRLDKNTKIHFGDSQKYFANIIYYAIRKKLLNLVSLLIDLSADIYSSYRGYTPLEYAVHKNHLEISELLFRNGGRFRPVFLTRIVQKHKECHSMMGFVDKLTG